MYQILSELDRLDIPNYYETLGISVLYIGTSLSSVFNYQHLQCSLFCLFRLVNHQIVSEADVRRCLKELHCNISEDFLWQQNAWSGRALPTCVIIQILHVIFVVQLIFLPCMTLVIFVTSFFVVACDRGCTDLLLCMFSLFINNGSNQMSTPHA